MKDASGWYGPNDGFARAQAHYDAEEPPYYSVADLDGEADGEEGDPPTADGA